MTDRSPIVGDSHAELEAHDLIFRLLRHESNDVRHLIRIALQGKSFCHNGRINKAGLRKKLGWKCDRFNFVWARAIRRLKAGSA